MRRNCGSVFKGIGKDVVQHDMAFEVGYYCEEASGEPLLVLCCAVLV